MLLSLPRNVEVQSTVCPEYQRQWSDTILLDPPGSQLHYTKGFGEVQRGALALNHSSVAGSV